MASSWGEESTSTRFGFGVSQLQELVREPGDSGRNFEKLSLDNGNSASKKWSSIEVAVAAAAAKAAAPVAACNSFGRSTGTGTARKRRGGQS